MLYLAEVQKQKSGFGLGGGKAELKLLAKQQGEHNWSAVPGEESIPVEDANKFNDGALVLVELSASKQVQRLQEAGRQLVSILQNFSRLHDKFKDKEEEIEQWKASLTFSSQEIYRREMELQVREEQVNHRETELEKLEEHRQEIENAREEAIRLQGEVEGSRREIEAAWEQLRGEMQRVEEMQVELKQSAVLDDEQATYIQDLLNYLSTSTPSWEDLQGSFEQVLELLGHQQKMLEEHWQALEEKKGLVSGQEEEVNRLNQQVEEYWTEWQKRQEQLLMSRSELKNQQVILDAKQEQAQVLRLQLSHHDEVYKDLCHLAESSDQVTLNQNRIDVEALEKMPIDQLQGLVQNLQQDLEKVIRFVSDQEEELNLQRETIQELQAKIQAASEYDRLSLEGELTEEQESFAMLNDSWLGSRRNLREREDALLQHQTVLSRRTGVPLSNNQEQRIDLAPILSHLEAQHHSLVEGLQKVEEFITEKSQSVSVLEAEVNRLTMEQEEKHREIKQLEQDLRHQRQQTSLLSGRIALYQEILQPWQDRLTELRHRLEEIQGVCSQVRGSSDGQQEAITQLTSVLTTLMEKPA